MKSRVDEGTVGMRLVAVTGVVLLVVMLAFGPGSVAAAAKDGEEAGYLDSLASEVASAKLVNRLEEGDAIPEFSLASLQGGAAVTKSSLQGKPVVLLFFGLDNEARRERSFAMLTSLQKLRAIHGDAIRFFGICSDPDSRAAAMDYARTSGLDVPLLDDSGRVAYTLFGIFMMPEALVLTADGHLDAKLPYTSNVEDQLSFRLRVLRGEVSEAEMQQARQVKAAAEYTPEEKKFRRHLSMARVLTQRKMYSKAMTEFAAAAKLQPDAPSPLTEMGFVQLKMHDWSGAIATFDKVLQMDPAVIDAVGGLGLALHGSGQDDDALPELQDAAAVLRPMPQVLIALAQIYAAKGQQDQALAMYQKAVDGLLAELDRGQEPPAAGQ